MAAPPVAGRAVHLAPRRVDSLRRNSSVSKPGAMVLAPDRAERRELTCQGPMCSRSQLNSRASRASARQRASAPPAAAAAGEAL